MAEDGIRTPDLKRPKLEADGEADTWKVDANLVLGFHFLDPDQEPHLVDEGSSFPAGMCHQHFGPDEVFPLLEKILQIKRRTYMLPFGCLAAVA